MVKPPTVMNLYNMDFFYISHNYIFPLQKQTFQLLKYDDYILKPMNVIPNIRIVDSNDNDNGALTKY